MDEKEAVDDEGDGEGNGKGKKEWERCRKVNEPLQKKSLLE